MPASTGERIRIKPAQIRTKPPKIKNNVTTGWRKIIKAKNVNLLTKI